MSTEEWSVGYDEGYMKGWNDAMGEKPAEASEPVAYIEHHKAGDNLVWDNPGANSSALYTTPQQRKPLTINEVEQILAQHNYEIHGDRARYIVRMTEAAHGIGVEK